MVTTSAPGHIRSDQVEPNKKYRKEIDGLRAIAVIAVIVNHFNPTILPGGFLGVDIFFVISGYVITKSLQRQQHSTLKKLVAGFYTRRIKRLFPALAICLVITSIAISVVNPEPIQSLRTGLMAVVGASNFYLIKNSTNYFAQSSELNPFLHTWSLAVEEQFYLVYPILFWACTSQRKIQKSLGLLAPTLLILSTLSLAGAIAMQKVNPDTAYFSMPFRFWEMAVGCLLCSKIFSSVKSRLLDHNSRFLCYLALFGLILLFTIPKSYITIATIGSVFCTSLFIITGEANSIPKKLLSSKYFVYTGALSYSLYLWHWPILSIGRWTIGVTSQTIIPLILLIIIVSAISYHFIEKPLRHNQWGKTHKSNMINGLTAITVTGLSIFGISRIYPLLYKATNQVNSNQTSFKTPLHWKDKKSKYADIIEKCHVNENSDLQIKILQECFGNNRTGDAKKAYFIGDSHAVNHYFGANKAIPEYFVGLYTSGWGCGYIPEEAALEISKINCSKYVSLINNYLFNNTVSGDIVFIGMRWVHKKHYALELQAEISKLAKKLEPKGVRIVILDDVAELPDTSLCTPRWYRPNANSNPLCQKPITKLDEELYGLTLLGHQLEKTNANVSFLRLRDAFCTGGQCSVFEKGIPLYIDEGHLTAESSERNAVIIRNHVQSLFKNK